jgi:hypothetical protein
VRPPAAARQAPLAVQLGDFGGDFGGFGDFGDFGDFGLITPVGRR